MFENLRRDRQADSERLQMLGVGLLIGAIVGAASALLLAPASGEQTRKLIVKRARKAYDQGADYMDDTWEDAEKAARRAARAGMKRARRQAAKVRELSEDALENGRRRLGV